VELQFDSDTDRGSLAGASSTLAVDDCSRFLSSVGFPTRGCVWATPSLLLVHPAALPCSNTTYALGSSLTIKVQPTLTFP
jgi:hypothetical protein